MVHPMQTAVKPSGPALTVLFVAFEGFLLRRPSLRLGLITHSGSAMNASPISRGDGCRFGEYFAGQQPGRSPVGPTEIFMIHHGVYNDASLYSIC